ncbi:hypothetical protein, partial [Actinoallomurus acaciae]
MAVLHEDRTLWMLTPGTGMRATPPLGRLAPSGRFQPFTPADGERAALSRAYAQARKVFGLPATYRFTASHADAMERLAALASNGGSRRVDWPALARQVNGSFLARGGDLPKLLSAARLTRDVHGRDFTIGQLGTVSRLADAVRADTTANVLSRTGRPPGNEVRLDDLYAVIRTFPGVDAGSDLTPDDARTLAGLMPRSGTAEVGALREAWAAEARALHDDATVALNQAMLAVTGLEPALTVLDPDTAARHLTDLDTRLARLSGIVEGSWRPDSHERVEAARTARDEIEAGLNAVYTEAVASLDRRIGERLAVFDTEEPGGSAALRERFETVDRTGGAAAVDDLLAIDAEAGTPVAPATAGSDRPRRARRLPGRVRFEAARD